MLTKGVQTVLYRAGPLGHLYIMEGFIPLARVLQIIDSGQPFDIEVVSADVARGTGGDLRTYSRCVKQISQKLSQRTEAKIAAVETRISKNPNHYQNSTRNIYLTDKTEVKKIHIRLITRFNGKQVL